MATGATAPLPPPDPDACSEKRIRQILFDSRRLFRHRMKGYGRVQAFEKTVLITGAGRGIGKRLAMGFAARGARVGLLARSRSEVELTRLEIAHAGGSALRLHADVRNYRQLKAAAGRLRARYGEIDVLLCAAAIQGPIGPVWETSPKAWRDVIETNLIGVLNSCRAVLPQMIERRRGKVIVLAGGGSTRGRPNFSAYAASKTAVVRLVETIAAELHDYNIQVNCLGPGATYTHMTDVVLKAGEKAGWKEADTAVKLRMSGGSPPEKQMELALFLASEESNHISGKLIQLHDDWKRLARSNADPELYTLRRVRKI